jgi:predicted AAA+ superfamily ATPase
MSFEEFLMANHDKSLLSFKNSAWIVKFQRFSTNICWNSLKRYFVVGGLPEVVATYCEHKDDLFKAFRL